MSIETNEIKLLGGVHRNLIFEGENPSDFQALLTGLLAEYKPATLHHQALVEDAAVAKWQLWRRTRLAQSHEIQTYERCYYIDDFTDAHFKRLRQMQQYRTAAERTCTQVFAKLDAIRKEETRNQQWQLTYDLKKQRLELAKGKRTTIAQEIVVSVEDGITITKKKRPNQNILAELATRAHHIFPVERITRVFEFKSEIPPEYNWLINEEADLLRSTFTQTFDAQTWQNLAAFETDHALAHPPPHA
jgi:hypothetical protein